MSNRYFVEVSNSLANTITDFSRNLTYLPIFFHCSKEATAVALGSCSVRSIPSVKFASFQNGAICRSILSQYSGTGEPWNKLSVELFDFIVF